MNGQDPADRHGEENLERLAQELLGRSCADLDPEERNVLARVAAGSYVGPDAAEAAQLNASRGDLLADRVAAVGGSWGFIIAFVIVLLAWGALNAWLLPLARAKPFDPYPFIFLNLMLSMLAAVQAPIIMMSQNRQSAKDRIAARHDYEVNLRTQLEILRLSRKIDKIARMALRKAREIEETAQDAGEAAEEAARVADRQDNDFSGSAGRDTTS